MSSARRTSLLAKNILWWFGHPVVYLLLFPAVAVYYWLIPRYAGRELVAGHVIAIAWTVAVIANVLVWAHHLYLDYPSGTPQAQINTAMQPITFALVLPSALSLYSLAFTIYRLAVPLDARVDRALLRPRRLAPRRPLRASSTRRSRSTSRSTTRSGSSATSITWRCSTSGC